MRHISEIPVADLRAARFVLCDIDDTLTHEGRLPAAAYGGLEALRDAGLAIIPITGRPAGWCDHIARMWPVEGVVGENGAFYFRYDETQRIMERVYARDAGQRRKDGAKLAELGELILTEVPGCAISADQAYREIDLAIDFSEDVPALPREAVTRIKQLFEENGATAKISSIHVNGWYGDHDKLFMARRFLNDVFSFDAEASPREVIFLGDSPNDEPMFAFFPNAIGVSNIKAFADRLASPPAWVTSEPGGHGFSEFASLMLKARNAQ